MDLRACKYSIIKYVPDELLGEVFNVGVILHNPNPFFLKMKTNTSRVRKINKNLELFELDLVLKYIKEVIDNAKSGLTETETKALFDDPNFLERFVTRFRDSVIITEPRTTLTENPLQELNELVHNYVQPTAQPRSPKVATRVMNKFREAGIEEKIKKGIDIDVDIVEKVQFGYQNGLPNLIQPIPLNGPVQTNFEKAAFWNLAVHEIRDKSRKYHNSPFYAVVMPSNEPQKDGFQTAVELLQQNFDDANSLLHVINFNESKQMDFLIEKIEKEAH